MIITSFNNQGLPQPKKQAFKAISCNDKTTAKLITSVKKRHLDYLEKTITEQLENPIDVKFGSKFGMFLTATVNSIYRIKNFKEHYKQKPIIESRIAFIKRVVDQVNEYKAQIAAAAKLHPEAFLQNRNLRQKELIKRLIQQG